MGMFDVYEPDEDLRCQRCESLLDDFQGKDGPCGLLVWRQGIGNPVGQAVAEDCRVPNEQLQDLRLPPTFQLYSYCLDCNLRCTARGTCVDEIWTHTRQLRSLGEQAVLEVLCRFDSEEITTAGNAVQDYAHLARVLAIQINDEWSVKGLTDELTKRLRSQFDQRWYCELTHKLTYKSTKLIQVAPPPNRAGAVDAVALQLFELLNSE
jgi:hypothetical protein